MAYICMETGRESIKKDVKTLIHNLLIPNILSTHSLVFLLLYLYTVMLCNFTIWCHPDKKKYKPLFVTYSIHCSTVKFFSSHIPAWQEVGDMALRQPGYRDARAERVKGLAQGSKQRQLGRFTAEPPLPEDEFPFVSRFSLLLVPLGCSLGI